MIRQTNGEPLDTYISYQDDVNPSVTWNTISRVRTTMDGLGRPIKTEVLDPATSTVKSITDTEYNSCACSPAGKLKRQSLPYAPGGTVLWTTYVYDGLGRTLQVIQPHTSGTGSAGTTSYAYAGNQVTVTDPAGRWKRYLQNALGNVVQVTEPNPAGGADYQTYYTYNIRDQLTQVQMPRPDQVGGTYTQTRTFVYDLTTGWMTSATNPENGTTTYNYDVYGRLNYKQDAKGQRLEYLYDVNNRVTKMTPKDASGTVVTCDVVEYFYDLTQSTYGRLSAMQWGTKDLDFTNSPLCAKGLHREEYTYTNGGRVTSKTFKLTRKFSDINNEERTAQMAIAYDYTTGQFPNQFASFTLNKVTYPTTYTQSGPQVIAVPGAVYQYTYDSTGRPTGETRDGSAVVDQVTYNTFGAMTQMRQLVSGGSKTETRAYDSFQRLTSMTTLDGAAITYTYSQTANDGKLVSQTTSGETVNYTYDSLGRLTQAATAGAGGWGMSWIYDGWGNRLNQTAVKGSVPTMVTLTDPATNRIQSHTYDANGNTTSTPQQGTMTYDVQNRLRTVASDTYGYDPGNKRIWKNDEYTFWGANGERIGRYSAVKLIDTNGGTPVHTFVFQKIQTDEYFGGRRLTSQDRLGSVGSYYPYGESRSGTVSNSDSFATYYRDSTGLDYADQRYYQTASARFATRDIVQSSARESVPETWNRYTYASNDPINLVDPNGLAACPLDTAYSVTVCAEPSTVAEYRAYYRDLNSLGMPAGLGGLPVRSSGNSIRALQDLIKDGSMTDCQAMAAFVMEAALWYEAEYPTQTFSSMVTRNVRFMTEFANFVPCNDPTVARANRSGLISIPCSSQAGSNYLQPAPGQVSGYGMFADNVPTADQSHHLSAYFILGFQTASYPGGTAAAMMVGIGSDFGNPGDQGLALAAIAIGAELRRGGISPMGVASAIAMLCK